MRQAFRFSSGGAPDPQISAPECRWRTYVKPGFTQSAPLPGMRIETMDQPSQLHFQPALNESFGAIKKSVICLNVFRKTTATKLK
ncbi:MAG: hypothetical protein KGY53_12670 [Wenzhouxiangellaceae bacterium]|nr:hypothetical protein [Wenzhouxiangellaceae bacterium]